MLFSGVLFVFYIHWYHYQAQKIPALSFLIIIFWVIFTKICLNITRISLMGAISKLLHIISNKKSRGMGTSCLDCKAGSYYCMFVLIYSAIMESRIKCQNIKTWVNLGLFCNNFKVMKIFEK